MGNIYGIANPLATPAVYVNTADQTLTAGTEVTIITTGALTALNPGTYVPMIWLYANILMGASLPSALQFAFKLGSGSDVDTQVVDVADATASKGWQYAVPLIGVPSATAWIGSGSTINITATATTNAATFKYATSRALVLLLRVDDA